MRLTAASRYAVGALAHMARKPDGTYASHDIARAEKLPERFLLKVLKPLVSVGILYAVRGPGGGYRLARTAKSVTLLEIVQAVDGPVRGEAPFTEGDGKLRQQLQAVCEQVAEGTRRALARVTVAQLAKAAK